MSESKDQAPKREFKGIWIEAEVWLDKNLSIMEKVMLAEIDSLSSDEKPCFSSNEYLAKFFGLSKSRVSKIISSLQEKGAISVSYTYHEGTKNIDKRWIRKERGYRRKRLGGIGENDHTPLGENSEDITKGLEQRLDNILPETSSGGDGNPSETIKDAKGKGRKPIKVANLSEGQSKETFRGVKEYFSNFYLEKENTDYYFTATDSAKIYSLIKKIYFKLEERHGKGYISNPEELISAASIFIKGSYETGDNYITNKFSLSIIDSQFNNLYTQLKNKKNGRISNPAPSKSSEIFRRAEQLLG